MKSTKVQTLGAQRAHVSIKLGYFCYSRSHASSLKVCRGLVTELGENARVDTRPALQLLVPFAEQADLVEVSQC
jgi:regulator of protease activity HflC (stomatin/prohibitin superfamily)